MSIEWTALDKPIDLREYPKTAPFTTREDYPGGGYSEWLTPGALLRLEDGRALLVGDVNTLGGTCDDCRERGVVVAYSLALVPMLPRSAP